MITDEWRTMRPHCSWYILTLTDVQASEWRTMRPHCSWYTLTLTDVQTSEWRTMRPHCAWKQKYKEVMQITSFFDEHAQQHIRILEY